LNIKPVYECNGHVRVCLTDRKRGGQRGQGNAGYAQLITLQEAGKYQDDGNWRQGADKMRKQRRKQKQEIAGE